MTPYNLSVKVIEKNQPELDMLLPGEPVAFQSPAPQKLAYALREAIASARHNKVEPYASLDFQFTQTHDQVLATPKSSLVTASSTIIESSHPEVKNEFDVIGAATKKPTEVMVFPNFEGETGSVEAWAHAKGYDVTHEPLTLTAR